MKAFLKRILTAPTFEDEEKTHQAYLLHVIVWALMIVPIPYFFYTVIRVPQDTTRALIQTIFGEIINLFLLFLIYRGYVRAASYIQVCAFWLFFTVTAATSAGIRSEAYILGYPLVIIISGVLLGVRATSILTTTSIVAGGLMVYAENVSQLTVTETSPSLSLWILSVLIFPMLVLVQYLSAYTIQLALKRARLSEDRYKLILSISSDYIYETVINEEGVNKLIWVGGAFEQLTGYTFEEYMASGSWVAHIHPDDLEKDVQDMATLSRNEDLKSEIRTKTKSGELRWVRISARPLWDDKKNRITGIIGAVQDITEIKIVEETEMESLQHQASMIQNVSDMAWLKDRDSRYLAVNEKFALLENMKKEEAVGKTDFDFSDPEKAEIHRRDDAIVMSTQKPKRIEEKIKDLSGKEYWVETIKTPIFNPLGEVIGTTGIARDINERKEAELAQQRRRELLEKVFELGKIVTEASDLRETIKKIWHGVHDVIQFDRLAIFLYNMEANTMDETFGTDMNGQMVDEWDISFPISEGAIFTQVFKKSDGIYFTHNYDVENNVEEGNEMYGVKDYAAIAAWAGTKPVAVICVDNLITQHPISDEQIEALRLFSGYAGLAIENSRLHEAVQNELTQQKYAETHERERRTILEKVIILGQYVTEANDIRTTLAKIWHGIHYDLGFDRLAIFLYNPTQKSMDGTFGTNNQGEMTDEWHISHSMNEAENSESQPFFRVLEKPDTIYVTRNFEEEYNIPAGHVMYGVKDFATIAAWAGDKPVAFISVDHNITHRPIAEEQLEALRLFAGYAGLAIENTRLNNALQNELSQQKNAETRERERRAILEKVVKLGQYVTEVHDLQTTLKRIWHGVRNELGFDRTGIYLYNADHKSMEGTFGTNNQGEILDEWHRSISVTEINPESASFLHVLQTPNSVYVTHNYEQEYQTSIAQIMYGVKDFAAIAARAGDKTVAVICVDQNITHREITEEQLEALRLFAGYAGLAIENARLNNALQNELSQRRNFIKELEAKNAELERFTYTVSHDLKSPLVTITGFLGYLEKDARAGDYEKMEKNTKRIHMAVEKMQRLLKDLLELSRIGRLINTPVEIPFSNIVRDAIELVHGQIVETKVAVEYQENDIIIKGDLTRLVEVIQNLIENSVKFMGKQPTPLIQIGVSKNEDSENIFYVKDNGIGIAPEYHEKIFGLFNKLDADSNGTGIGLTLVKRIIEVHGGRIWIESQVGKGTTFYFTIPQ